jgi:ATP-dependent DNA helicase RecQ
MAVRSADKLAALATYFGYTSFRPMQESIIDNVLSGADTFVLMPTGGGKSLCYQLPAILLDGVTIVVSPLIALMKDQVDALSVAGVGATFLNSSIAAGESSVRLKGLFRGDYKLLYLAPERLMMEGFLEIVQKLPINLIAVDEAHCISEWGHDFRPEYRKLKELRTLFPGIPVVALTATATDQVQRDIVTQLRIGSGPIFKASFVRDNLYYEVRPKQDSYTQIRTYIRSRPGEAGIIYCGTRNGSESIAAKLQKDGIRAAAYHAGIPAKDRNSRQEEFLRDDLDVMVATIAFGMGIDKPNIRFVIHYDLPRNIEGYYQETGRAGRDSLQSECILFYSYGDKMKIDRFIEDKSPQQQEIARAQLMQMIGYAEATRCRHRIVAEYFGETFDRDNCGMCDNCTKPIEQVDATIMAQKFLSCVKRTGERFGSGYVIDVLCGSENARVLQNRHSNLSVYGIGKDHNKKEWLQLSRTLLSMGYTIQGDYNVLRLSDKAGDILFGNERLFIKPLPKSIKDRPMKEFAGPYDKALFSKLRSLRKVLADEQDLPPYIIFSDASLQEMARTKPTTLTAFRQISGVGDRKLQQYGETFLETINEHLYR